MPCWGSALLSGASAPGTETMSRGTIRSKSSTHVAVGPGDLSGKASQLFSVPRSPSWVGTSLSDSVNLFQQPASACRSSCTPNVGHPLS